MLAGIVFTFRRRYGRGGYGEHFVSGAAGGYMPRASTQKEPAAVTATPGGFDIAASDQAWAPGARRESSPPAGEAGSSSDDPGVGQGDELVA